MAEMSHFQPFVPGFGRGPWGFCGQERMAVVGRQCDIFGYPKTRLVAFDHVLLS